MTDGSLVYLDAYFYVNFGEHYNAANLITPQRKKRYYAGINWEELEIRDCSKKEVGIGIIRAKRDVMWNEVLKVVNRQYPEFSRPFWELPLCLMKRYPKKHWNPAWVFLHEPIIQPQREYPHVLVLSGSQVSAARIGNMNPFSKENKFIFVI